MQVLPSPLSRPGPPPASHRTRTPPLVVPQRPLPTSTQASSPLLVVLNSVKSLTLHVALSASDAVALHRILSSVIAGVSAQQRGPVALAQSAAPISVFADSPDQLDDLDIDSLVSAHVSAQQQQQQQAARPQPVQKTAAAAHAACSIVQATQRHQGPKLAETGPSRPASLLGAPARSTTATATFTATAAQLLAARVASADVAHDVAHASAAPRVPVAHESVQRVPPAVPPSAVQQGMAGPSAALCSHGVPMQQCRHKQEHLNQMNAELVEILLGDRTAPPGEQERLKELKKSITEAIRREADAPQPDAGQHCAPVAGASQQPSNATGASASYASRPGSSFQAAPGPPPDRWTGTKACAHQANSSLAGGYAENGPLSLPAVRPAPAVHQTYEGASRGGAYSGGNPVGRPAATAGSDRALGNAYGDRSYAGGMGPSEPADYASMIPDPALRQSFDQNVEEVTYTFTHH